MGMLNYLQLVTANNGCGEKVICECPMWHFVMTDSIKNLIAIFFMNERKMYYNLNHVQSYHMWISFFKNI